MAAAAGGVWLRAAADDDAVDFAKRIGARDDARPACGDLFLRGPRSSWTAGMMVRAKEFGEIVLVNNSATMCVRSLAGSHPTHSFRWRSNAAADRTDTSSVGFCPPHSFLCPLRILDRMWMWSVHEIYLTKRATTGCGRQTRPHTRIIKYNQTRKPNYALTDARVQSALANAALEKARAPVTAHRTVVFAGAAVAANAAQFGGGGDDYTATASATNKHFDFLPWM